MEDTIFFLLDSKNLRSADYTSEERANDELEFWKHSSTSIEEGFYIEIRKKDNTLEGSEEPFKLYRRVFIDRNSSGDFIWVEETPANRKSLFLIESDFSSRNGILFDVEEVYRIPTPISLPIVFYENNLHQRRSISKSILKSSAALGNPLSRTHYVDTLAGVEVRLRQLWNLRLEFVNKAIENIEALVSSISTNPTSFIKFFGVSDEEFKDFTDPTFEPYHDSVFLRFLVSKNNGILLFEGQGVEAAESSEEPIEGFTSYNLFQKFPENDDMNTVSDDDVFIDNFCERKNLFKAGYVSYEKEVSRHSFLDFRLWVSRSHFADKKNYKNLITLISNDLMQVFTTNLESLKIEQVILNNRFSYSAVNQKFKDIN